MASIPMETNELISDEPSTSREPVFVQYDPPHLIKSVRNALINNTISHSSNGIADINVLHKIYEFDAAQKCKMLPKITKKHLYPNSFEKMNVAFAAQLLSNTVCCAIKTAVQTCPEILGSYMDSALPTAHFIERFNNIFDCLNCRNFSSKSPFEKPLKVDNNVYKYLNDSLGFLEYLKIISKNENYFKFIKGFQTTIKAQLLMIEYLNKNCNIEYVLTGRTNQDCLEIFFSKLRAKGGFNYTPNSHEIGVHFANILVTKLIFSSAYSNCLADDGSMVELEWGTFQEDYKASLFNMDDLLFLFFETNI